MRESVCVCVHIHKSKEQKKKRAGGEAAEFASVSAERATHSQPAHAPEAHKPPSIQPPPLRNARTPLPPPSFPCPHSVVDTHTLLRRFFASSPLSSSCARSLPPPFDSFRFYACYSFALPAASHLYLLFFTVASASSLPSCATFQLSFTRHFFAPLTCFACFASHRLTALSRSR